MSITEQTRLDAVYDAIEMGSVRESALKHRVSRASIYVWARDLYPGEPLAFIGAVRDGRRKRRLREARAYAAARRQANKAEDTHYG